MQEKVAAHKKSLEAIVPTATPAGMAEGNFFSCTLAHDFALQEKLAAHKNSLEDAVPTATLAGMAEGEGLFFSEMRFPFL